MPPNRRPGLLLALLIVAAGSAQAQTVPDSAATWVERRMQDSVTVLPPVIVRDTLLRLDERTSATSLRLDRSALGRFLPSTTADALIAAPGLDLVKTGPWASRISFRGFSGERVLVLVDGVRLNTGRGHGALTSLIPVDRLEQVELWPGSGGSAYGSDAMGGVVNLVTHRSLLDAAPRLALATSVRGSEPGGESATTARLRFLSPHVGAEITGGLASLNGLHTPSGRVPNSGSRDDDLGGRMSLKVGEGFFDYEHTRHAAHDVGLPAFAGSSGASGRYPLQSRDADRLELDLPMPSHMAHLRVLGTQQRYRSDFDEITVDSIFSSRSRQLIALRTNDAGDRLTTRSSGAQPEIRLGRSEEWKLAGEYRRETTGGPRETDVTVVNSAGATTSATEVLSESVPHSWRDVAAGSFFGGHTTRLARVELGARYDWFRSRADSTPTSSTSRLDVVDRRWSLEGGLSRRFGSVEPYARVASGFRVPNLEERYFHGLIHGGLWVFGDPDLVAERSLTWEAGTRVAIAGRGDVRISAYRSDVDDFITLVYLGQLYLIPRFQYRNVQRARIEGLETVVRVDLGASKFALAASFPRGRDREDGSPLVDIGVARVTVDASTRIDHVVPQGTVAFRARWSDGVKSDPQNESTRQVFARPAFWTCALELGAGLAGGRATISVRNLFNHAYREPSSFIDEPGRTVTLAFRRDFTLPLGTALEERR
jgi:hemoglobin/transferrin/lactoferrin receptor protein